MITLRANKRENFGKKTKLIKMNGKIPAVLYGPKVDNLVLEVDEKEFKEVYKQAGENSLVELVIDGNKRLVLINDIQKNSISDKVIHIDFFQASLTEEVEVMIPLVFEGVAPAEKDLGETLVKNILEVEVKALPQNLPHEIKVNIDSLKTFSDHILIKDLVLPPKVEILKKPDEIVASVLEPQKIEEELAQEIKEDVEGIEKVEKEKKEEEVVEVQE